MLSKHSVLNLLLSPTLPPEGSSEACHCRYRTRGENTSWRAHQSIPVRTQCSWTNGSSQPECWTGRKLWTLWVQWKPDGWKKIPNLKCKVKNAKQLNLHRTYRSEYCLYDVEKLLRWGTYWVFIMLQPPTSISYTLAFSAQLSGFSSFS